MAIFFPLALLCSLCLVLFQLNLNNIILNHEGALSLHIITIAHIISRRMRTRFLN